MTDYIDILNTIVWYNGMTDILEGWLKFTKNEHGVILPDYQDMEIEPFYKGQIQVIWMICVLQFGDYGVSPRYGWIENEAGFKKFVKQLVDGHEEEEYDI